MYRQDANKNEQEFQLINTQIPNGFELVLSTDIQNNANMQWAMISSDTHYKSQGLAVMVEYTINVKKVACQACSLQRGMKSLLGEYLPDKRYVYSLTDKLCS